MVTRELGEKIAISIPTAVPFEEQITTQPPQGYVLWMNLQTLFRNYFGAIEDPFQVDRGPLAAAFLEEIRTICGLLEGVMAYRFYLPDPSRLPKRYPHARVKTPHTQKQLETINRSRLCIQEVLNSKAVEVIKCEQRLPEYKERVWLLTHWPLDLMSRYSFIDTQLLESHTGEIKPPVKWNTKLTGGEKYRHIPFNFLSLQVLGDQSTLFYSHKKVYKENLLQIAKQSKWHPGTTNAKVKSDIKKHSKPEIADLFGQMMSPKFI